MMIGVLIGSIIPMLRRVSQDPKGISISCNFKLATSTVAWLLQLFFIVVDLPESHSTVSTVGVVVRERPKPKLACLVPQGVQSIEYIHPSKLQYTLENYNASHKNHPIEKDIHLPFTSIVGFQPLIFQGVIPELQWHFGGSLTTTIWGYQPVVRSL